MTIELAIITHVQNTSDGLPYIVADIWQNFVHSELCNDPIEVLQKKFHCIVKDRFDGTYLVFLSEEDCARFVLKYA